MLRMSVADKAGETSEVGQTCCTKVGMHRNQNHQFNNGNAQRNFNPPYARTSLRQHLKQKWFSTLIGCVGFLSGIFLIIGNEARAVKVSKSLEESIALVTSLVPDVPVDSANIGKLVYLTGVMTIHEPLTEVDYGISILAVKLLRQVQMYQWVESKITHGDAEGMTTSYSYYTDWQDWLIDSSSFHTSMGHWNPKEFPIKRQTQINENVKIGNYYLGLDLKKKFTDFTPITGDERPEKKDIKLHAGLYYHSQNIWNPEVGDVRIQFSYAGHQGQVITVIAKLDDTLTLVPYSTKQDVNILILRLGYYSLEDMFAFVHAQNKFSTWVFRGAGWLLLYISCVSLATVLQIIVSHSNFLQELLPVSHSSLKMTVSMCMSLIITALAWVWYRPILGIGLIIATMSVLFFTKWFADDRPRGRYNRL